MALTAPSADGVSDIARKPRPISASAPIGLEASSPQSATGLPPARALSTICSNARSTGGESGRLRNGHGRRTAQAPPQDDIITKLINADKDGRGLNDDEFGYFVMMLAVAGNETTRNAITHGMHAFLTNPDQWKLWVEERPDTMVDEVIRWASPIIVFQRTAINDTMVGDVLVKAEASNWGCSTSGAARTRTSSRTRTRSTSCATRTRTWPSVATARTTA